MANILSALGPDGISTPIRVDEDGSLIVVDPTASRVENFSDLSDVPIYTGNAYKVIAVNDTENGLDVGHSYGNFYHNANWQSGRWYGPPSCIPYQPSTRVVQTLVSISIYAGPIFVPNDVAFSDIAFNISGSSAGNIIRVGIYESDVDEWRPTNLISELGQIPATSNGVKTLTLDSAMNLVGRKWYWIAMRAAVNVRVSRYDAAVMLGGDGSATGNTKGVVSCHRTINGNGATDPLPAVFGTPNRTTDLWETVIKIV